MSDYLNHFLRGLSHKADLPATFLDWQKDVDDEQCENMSNLQSDEPYSTLLQRMAFDFLGKDPG